MRKLRTRIFVIIFGTNTKPGKLFDVALLYLIVLSVIIVILESVAQFRESIPNLFNDLEWIFTIIFTPLKVSFIGRRI